MCNRKNCIDLYYVRGMAYDAGWDVQRKRLRGHGYLLLCGEGRRSQVCRFPKGGGRLGIGSWA
jgi:hypothetical protein